MASSSKFQTIHGEDIISSLPNSLLCHILSFLPTKFVVATSTLSTRWKDIWPSIPNLDFDDSLFLNPLIDRINPRERQSFMNFVDRVLGFRDRSITLNSFSLSCSGNCEFIRVSKWVCTAVAQNAKEIKLGLNLRDPFALPREIFLCQSLMVLELNWKILVDVSQEVCFSNLKVLSFYGVKFFSCECLETILGGCPVLEDLVIRKCRWVRGDTWKICGSALKKLILDWHAVVRVQHECGIVIDAPALECLHIKDYTSENFLVKNLGSLVEANVDVAQKFESFVPVGVYGNSVFDLLKGICTVKFLSLSGDTMEAISHAYDYKFPTFFNLIRLEISVDAWSGWTLLANLLASSPFLQSLVFVEGLVQYFNSHFDLSWSPPQHVPPCLSSHIKEIEIRKFRGVAEELTLVKYLLKNAKVLKKMSIDCSYMKEDLKIQKKLHRFHRVSTSCHLDLII
ncbi:hypothetical protein NMG60_11025649 [Bertholletia excelsa]